MSASTIYISYVAEDMLFCAQLRSHLAALRDKGIAHIWEPAMIGPGQDISAETHRHLAAAQVIVLLVSSDYLDACHEAEPRNALSRSKDDNVCTIPVLIRKCVYKDTPFAHLPIYPKGPDGLALAVAMWPHRDDAWACVVEAIREAVTTRDKETTDAFVRHAAAPAALRPTVALTVVPSSNPNRAVPPVSLGPTSAIPPLSGNAPRPQPISSRRSPTSVSTPIPAASSPRWSSPGSEPVGAPSWTGSAPRRERRGGRWMVLGLMAVAAVTVIVVALAVGIAWYDESMAQQASPSGARPRASAQPAPLATMGGGAPPCCRSAPNHRVAAALPAQRTRRTRSTHSWCATAKPEAHTATRAALADRSSRPRARRP